MITLPRTEARWAIVLIALVAISSFGCCYWVGLIHHAMNIHDATVEIGLTQHLIGITSIATAALAFGLVGWRTLRQKDRDDDPKRF